MPVHAKIAVIGASSFTGSHFVKYAREAGSHVLEISRPRFDLLRPDEIIQSIKAFKPNSIVNFASASLVAESWKNPSLWFQTNVMSQIKIHESLRSDDYLEKFVQVSTPEVYGSSMFELRENTNYNPTTPYATSRAACDLSLMNYFKQYEFPVVFTRSANVYGNNQRNRIIPIAAHLIKHNEPIPLEGGGKSFRCFIHVNDVVSGTWRTLNADAGEIFHFSNGRPLQIYELVQKVAKHLKKEARIKITEERPGKDFCYFLNYMKAKAVLGWYPHIDLEDGLHTCAF